MATHTFACGHWISPMSSNVVSMPLGIFAGTANPDWLPGLAPVPGDSDNR